MEAAAARERQFRAGCDEARLAECGARAREVAAQQLVQVRRDLCDARGNLGVWRGTPDAAWRTPARGGCAVAGPGAQQLRQGSAQPGRLCGVTDFMFLCVICDDINPSMVLPWMLN